MKTARKLLLASVMVALLVVLQTTPVDTSMYWCTENYIGGLQWEISDCSYDGGGDPCAFAESYFCDGYLCPLYLGSGASGYLTQCEVDPEEDQVVYAICNCF